MNPRARRFLSWAFILTFFLLAPAIILSTAGYRYNFERGRLERTGVVIVETRPTGASVNLNGKLQNAQTPARLGRITPGTYAVRVEKSGYHAWMKTVSVGSRETVFLNQIALFRSEAPTPVLTFGTPSVAAFSSNARRGAAVVSASSGSELAVIDTRDGGMHLPYRSSAEAASFNLRWSPSGRFLLVERTGRTPSFLLWNASDPERVHDLSSVAGITFAEMFWAQDADRLYGVAKGALYAVDASALTAVPSGPSIAEPVIAGETLYGIVPGEAPTLARRRLREQNFETIAQLPSVDFTPVPGRDRRVSYVSVSGERLFTIDPAGDRPTAFEGRGHDGVWSSDGARLLYWSNLEIRIYDTRTGSDELLNRLSGSIAQAAWHVPEWNVLYAVGNSLFSIETDELFGRVTVPLATFDILDRFAVSPNGDNAFIFGTKDGATGLWKLRLR